MATSRKHFAVGVSVLTKAQEQAFIGYLREIGVRWWHWIAGFWMVTGNDLEASMLRNKLKMIAPTARIMVLEVSPVTWSGSGPKGEGNEPNMFKWMRSTWTKRE